jgi:hypothetical protein
MWAVNASGSLTARAVPRLLAFDVHIADTDAAEPTGREQVWTVAAVAVNMAFAPYTDRLLALAHPTARMYTCSWPAMCTDIAVKYLCTMCWTGACCVPLHWSVQHRSCG